MGSGFPTNLVSVCFTFDISDEGVFVLSHVTSGCPVMRIDGLRHLSWSQHDPIVCVVLNILEIYLVTMLVHPYFKDNNSI